MSITSADVPSGAKLVATSRGATPTSRAAAAGKEIGRGSWRERGENSVVAGSLKKKKERKTGTGGDNRPNKDAAVTLRVVASLVASRLETGELQHTELTARH